jgi:hypothetical protein
MKTAFKALDRGLHAIFGSLTPAGRFWLYLGAGSLACAAAMCLAYGFDISIKHALFLFCISLVAAFMPHAAHDQFEERRYLTCLAVTCLFVPLALIEFQSHAGYTAGLRGSNIEDAKVQNMKYDGAQDTASENSALLASFKKQLSDFRTKNGEWVTTASADALRKQLGVLQKEIDLEAARNGCKAKCAARMKDKADVEGKIATIEEGNALAAKITAQQALVDKRREVASTVEHKSSAVAHQEKFLTKVAYFGITGSFSPSDKLKADLIAEGTTQAINIAMAAAATGVPALCFFLAGLYRREEDGKPSTGAREPFTLSAHTQTAPKTETKTQINNMHVDWIFGKTLMHNAPNHA